MKTFEEETYAFRSLLTNAVEIHNGDKLTAYVEVLNTLMESYVNIPMEADKAAKTVENNIFWLIQDIRLQQLVETAQLEALDSPEENPE